MEKILDKIYSEKDSSTNIAIFVGSVSALYIYIHSDKDPFLGIIAFLSLFSLTKIISKVVIEKYQLKKKDINNKKNYSDVEKNVILSFVKAGTCFLSISDLNKGKFGTINNIGLDSLVARGIIEFIDGSIGIGPTGFHLREDVYQLFLC